MSSDVIKEPGVPLARWEGEPADPAVLADGFRFPYACNIVTQNRLMKSAMSEQLATYVKDEMSKSGIPTEELINLYRKFGEGGYGTIVTGCIMISGKNLEAPGNVIIDKEFDTQERRDAFKRWTSAAKAHGSLMIAQLFHPGKYAAKLKDKSNFDINALTREEIQKLIEEYAYAAKFAQDCGFDGVEISSAYFFTLGQFLTDGANTRSDEYGGSLQNRSRLLFNIIQKLRMRLPRQNNFIFGVKFYSGNFEPGYKEDDFGEFVHKVEKTGFDYVTITGGHYNLLRDLPKDGSGSHEHFYQRLVPTLRKNLTRTKLFMNGNFVTLSDMCGAVQQRWAAGISLAKPAAAEPDLPKKLLFEGAKGAVKSLVDPIDFLLEQQVAGTQLWQHGMLLTAMDPSNPAHLEQFYQSLSKYNELQLRADETKSERLIGYPKLILQEDNHPYLNNENVYTLTALPASTVSLPEVQKKYEEEILEVEQRDLENVPSPIGMHETKVTNSFRSYEHRTENDGNVEIVEESYETVTATKVDYVEPAKETMKSILSGHPQPDDTINADKIADIVSVAQEMKDKVEALSVQQPPERHHGVEEPLLMKKEETVQESQPQAADSKQAEDDIEELCAKVVLENISLASLVCDFAPSSEPEKKQEEKVDAPKESSQPQAADNKQAEDDIEELCAKVVLENISFASLVCDFAPASEPEKKQEEKVDVPLEKKSGNLPLEASSESAAPPKTTQSDGIEDDIEEICSKVVLENIGLASLIRDFTQTPPESTSEQPHTEKKSDKEETGEGAGENIGLHSLIEAVLKDITPGEVHEIVQLEEPAGAEDAHTPKEAEHITKVHFKTEAEPDTGKADDSTAAELKKELKSIVEDITTFNHLEETEFVVKEGTSAHEPVKDQKTNVEEIHIEVTSKNEAPNLREALHELVQDAFGTEQPDICTKASEQKQEAEFKPETHVDDTEEICEKVILENISLASLVSDYVMPPKAESKQEVISGITFDNKPIVAGLAEFKEPQQRVDVPSVSAEPTHKPTETEADSSKTSEAKNEREEDDIEELCAKVVLENISLASLVCGYVQPPEPKSSQEVIAGVSSDNKQIIAGLTEDLPVKVSISSDEKVQHASHPEAAVSSVREPGLEASVPLKDEPHERPEDDIEEICSKVVLENVSLASLVCDHVKPAPAEVEDQYKDVKQWLVFTKGTQTTSTKESEPKADEYKDVKQWLVFTKDESGPESAEKPEDAKDWMTSAKEAVLSKVEDAFNSAEAKVKSIVLNAEAASPPSETPEDEELKEFEQVKLSYSELAGERASPVTHKTMFGSSLPEDIEIVQAEKPGTFDGFEDAKNAFEEYVNMGKEYIEERLSDFDASSRPPDSSVKSEVVEDVAETTVKPDEKKSGGLSGFFKSAFSNPVQKLFSDPKDKTETVTEVHVKKTVELPTGEVYEVTETSVRTTTQGDIESTMQPEAGSTHETSATTRSQKKRSSKHSKRDKKGLDEPGFDFV